MCSKDEVNQFRSNPSFEPGEALQCAQEYLNDNPKDPDAHYLAFMAHAEIFAGPPLPKDAELQAREAVNHYQQAVAAQDDCRLFPAKYNIQALLGVGAFAYVFKVDEGGSAQALKVFKQAVQFNPQARQTFQQSMANLDKEGGAHIVKVNDLSGLAAKHPYYVMEFVKGESLRRWIEGHAPIRSDAQHWKETYKEFFLEVLQIAGQVAEGLRAAHEIGVLHLDLKPENVLLSTGNEAKLIDFNFMTVERGRIPYRSLGPVQTTILYTAPEVIDDINRAGPQADVFSFGLLVLEMLTGELDRRGISDHIAHEHPQLAILLRACVDRKPERRPKNFGEVIESIREVEKDLTERVTQEKESHEKNWLLRVLTKLEFDPFGVIQSLAEVLSEKRGKELKLGGLVGPVAIGFLLAKMFLDGPSKIPYLHLTYDLDFIACFLGGLSFSVLGYLYFLNISYRCRFQDAPVISWVRLAMSLWYAIPILIGSFWWPQYWQFFASAGMVLVFLNNTLMYRYALRYQELAPEVFGESRALYCDRLKGYMINAVAGVVFLLGMGGAMVALRSKVQDQDFVRWFDIGLAVLVTIYNILLIPNAVTGDSARYVWEGLALEYAIRQQYPKSGALPLK